MGRFAEVRADPTLAPRTKSEAFKEGLRDAPYMALGAAMLPVDIIESGLDALRGVRSPNRMIQAASGWKQLFGGDPIPQPYERSPHEDWSVQKYELAGNLANPLAYGNPARAMASVPKAIKHGALEFVRAQAPAHVVKPKGGNWLAGSVEDALSGLKRANVPDPALGGDPKDPRMALGNWIEGPLTKYVKTRMASPDDEVRKLAEQGVLHFGVPPQPGAAWIKDRQILGQSDLAKNWEAAADQIPQLASYRDHMPLRSTLIKSSKTDEDLLRELGGQFAVDNPESLAFQFNRGRTPENLGFPHLIDELGNALNPASGLPRNLLLTPEAVQNMSMEKAVRRVADINAWRADHMAKARMDATAGRPMVRDYPHTPEAPNPKGLRWVQLQKEGDFAAESDAMGHSARGYEPEHLGGSRNYGLGGWDAIQSGKAKVYSLQDAKGEPHVTVEVGNKNTGVMKYDDFLNANEDVSKKFGKHLDKIEYEEGRELNDDELEEVLHLFMARPAIARRFSEFSAKHAQTPAIIQIKGKQNRAPNPEYLPFVQDFVRNPHTGQPWSDVGDLENTGLLGHHDAWQHLYEIDPVRAKKFMDEAPPSGFWSLEDLDKFAHGGLAKMKECRCHG